jgi:hypothetical protein
MKLQEAQSRIYMFDINGLLESTRKARPADLVAFIRGHVYKPEYVNEAAGLTATA